MNREIKFRVWDKMNKRMNPHTRGFISQHGEFMTDLDPTGLNMQGVIKVGFHRNKQYEFAGLFTGYKDREDVEIYEGDILRCGKKGICSVGWQDGGFAFCNNKDWLDDWNWADDSHRFTVIGNIYKNPELL